MLSRGLECFDRVGMLPTVLEYLCTEMECFLGGRTTYVMSWRNFVQG
jgi:hypothetical protein